MTCADADLARDVHDLLRPGGVLAAHQPVVRISDVSIVGYEALARMPGSGLAPDEWLSRAADAGLRDLLELACLRAAVDGGLPPHDGSLFVNLSPSLLDHPRVRETLAPIAHRTVIELSEHEAVADYDHLQAAVERWQDEGASIAVDDTGAGHASLQHVFRIQPDYIKLDRRLVRHLHHDRSMRALLASAVAYARETGATVVAEGVETEAQLRAVQEAGVDLVQGYLLARPDFGWQASIDRAASLRLDACATVADVGETVCARLADRGVIPSLYLARDGLLRCVAQRGVWQVLDGMAPTAGITGRAFSTGALVVAHDVSRDDDYVEAIPGVVAEACVPVTIDGEPVGALNIDCRRPLDQGDVDELVRCGEEVGRWLRTGRHDPKPEPLARLVAGSARLARAASPSAVSQVVMEIAVDVTGMPSAMVVHPPPRTGSAPSVVAHGQHDTLLRSIAPEDLVALLDVVLPSRACYSAGDDDAVAMVGTDALRRAGLRCMALAPIRPDVGTPALLAIASPQRRKLDTDTIELLELLAAQAAARLETLGHMSELHRRATEDSLTGIGNRAAFTEVLDRWERGCTSGAIALIDVDDFKLVNDTCGHLEGDRLLAELAARLRGAVRPTDGVYRIGGDEFAVLLEGADLHDAEVVVRRIELETAPALHPRGAGLSIGVAAVNAGTQVDFALREADQCLYQVKRDRKEVAARALG